VHNFFKDFLVFFIHVKYLRTTHETYFFNIYIFLITIYRCARYIEYMNNKYFITPRGATTIFLPLVSISDIHITTYHYLPLRFFSFLHYKTRAFTTTCISEYERTKSSVIEHFFLCLNKSIHINGHQVNHLISHFTLSCSSIQVIEYFCFRNIGFTKTISIIKDSSPRLTLNTNNAN
jgi:hypothetical protein